MITVPEDFAISTITREGEAGRRWIAELPHRVADLCQQWDLVVDGPVMHGYVGLAIPVRRGDEACVLKVSWIDASSRDEATALAAWDGCGAVRLLAVQPEHGAMLLERVDFGRSLNEVDIGEAVAVAGRLLRRLAIPAPDGLRSQQTMADENYRTLPARWEQFGRPFAQHLLDYTRELARQIGPATANLLVDYDLHYEDILASAREPWLAVDPKVIAGEPEFGVAQLLWCRLEDMEAAGGLERHVHTLVQAAELDPERTRAWAIVRCVDYWLWGLSVGLTYDPARCKIIVERLVECRP